MSELSVHLDQPSEIKGNILLIDDLSENLKLLTSNSKFKTVAIDT